MDYDVIVVGAGPAGASCARELAKKKHRVLVIDRTQEIGEPNYSTAGTKPELIKEFALPQSVVLKSWNSLILQGPSAQTKFSYDRIIGYTLNFRALRQFLIQEAIENGADVWTDTLAKDLIRQDNKIVGLNCSQLGKDLTVSSKIIIDATGVEGRFSSQLGLRNNKKTYLGIGYEQLMVNLDLEDQGNCVYVGLGSTYTPTGYSWIFPTGKKEAKVGIGWCSQWHKEKLDIKEYFNRYISSQPATKNAEELETHIHSIVVDSGNAIKQYSMDGFITIGEAACQANPLMGEGIRHSMRSGRFAAEIISQAIAKNDFTRRELKNYDQKWRAYIGNKWKTSRLIAKLLYQKDDKFIDRLISSFAQLDKEDFLKILWEYDLKSSAKLLALLGKSYLKFIK